MEMDERSAVKNHKDSEESSPLPHSTDNNMASTQEKAPPKRKKDNLKEKKRAKKQPQTSILSNNHIN